QAGVDAALRSCLRRHRSRAGDRPPHGRDAGGSRGQPCPVLPVAGRAGGGAGEPAGALLHRRPHPLRRRGGLSQRAGLRRRGGVGGRGMPARVSAYTASKAAVAGLTETLSRELAPFGILVNAVAPGAISTSLIDTVIEAGPDAAGAAFHAGSVAQCAGGDSLTKV